MSRVVGTLLAVLGALAAVALLVLDLMPELQYQHYYLTVAATLIPFLWLPVLATFVGLLLACRGLARVAVAIGLVLPLVVWGVPLVGTLERDDKPAGELQFVSLNAMYGSADVDGLLDEVQPTTTVLVVQELTPDFLARLREAGIDKDFPYFEGEAREGAGGTGIFSRRPMKQVAKHDEVFLNLVVELETERGQRFRVAAVHTAPPPMGVDVWRRDAGGVAAMLRPYKGEPLLAVGDFNAISRHATLRMFTDGLRMMDPDGGSLILSGRSQLTQWQPTWPVGGRLPAFARIDHALVHAGGAFAQPHYFTVSGTDHKGIRGGIWASPR